MRLSEFFLINFFALFVINLLLPSFDVNRFGVGLMTSFLISVLITGVISGIQVLGSGLNATATWLIFAISMIATLMFGIPINIANVGTIQIGLGLISNVFTYSYPLYIQLLVVTIGIMTVISFILMIVGGGRAT
jgi:hypothetical protein